IVFLGSAQRLFSTHPADKIDRLSNVQIEFHQICVSRMMWCPEIGGEHTTQLTIAIKQRCRLESAKTDGNSDIPIGICQLRLLHIFNDDAFAGSYCAAANRIFIAVDFAEGGDKSGIDSLLGGQLQYPRRFVVKLEIAKIRI